MLGVEHVAQGWISDIAGLARTIASNDLALGWVSDQPHHPTSHVRPASFGRRRTECDVDCTSNS